MKASSLAAPFIALAAGCGQPEGSPAKPEPPAVVRTILETGLGEVTLTTEARERLGVDSVALERVRAPRQRLLAGEVVLALGDGSPGGSAAASIYGLVPPRSAADLERVADLQLAADGAVESARIVREAARETLQRAEALLASRAGSGRSVDEAREKLALAEAALRNARQRRDLLGAPLFDAVGAQRVWVRVGIYEGERRNLDLEAPAAFRPLGAPAAEPAGALVRVAVPLSASGTGATSDLYYAPTEAATALRPGARIAVLIPLREDEGVLRAPASAVVRDSQGGAWIYEEASRNTFVRRRIEVRDTRDGFVTLSAGPPEGSHVVAPGAAELFGTELGFAK